MDPTRSFGGFEQSLEAGNSWKRDPLSLKLETTVHSRLSFGPALRPPRLADSSTARRVELVNCRYKHHGFRRCSVFSAPRVRPLQLVRRARAPPRFITPIAFYSPDSVVRHPTPVPSSPNAKPNFGAPRGIVVARSRRFTDTISILYDRTGETDFTSVSSLPPSSRTTRLADAATSALSLLAMSSLVRELIEFPHANFFFFILR